MIKKNLVLTVTEKQSSGEETLYTIKSVNDRNKFLLEAGAPSILVSDTEELLTAIGLVQDFGKANPTNEEEQKGIIQQENFAPMNFDLYGIESMDNIPVVENLKRADDE